MVHAGEDFKYSPAVIEKGGGHVLQLFLSKDEADEVQIRGRVARKNEKGSYSLLLSWEALSSSSLHNQSLKELQQQHGEEQVLFWGFAPCVLLSVKL